MKPKLIRVVQNYDAVILVTKLSLYDLSVRSQYFSVQRFHVSRIYALGAWELWSLNERSWNFETLEIDSKGPFLS